MSTNNQCRLCFSCDQGEHMNIFRENDLGMKISDIISEHFKCEITETDALPKQVCQKCWAVTVAFHSLYLRTKLAQDTFLGRLQTKNETSIPHKTTPCETIFVDELEGPSSANLNGNQSILDTLHSTLEAVVPVKNEIELDELNIDEAGDNDDNDDNFDGSDYDDFKSNEDLTNGSDGSSGNDDFQLSENCDSDKLAKRKSKTAKTKKRPSKRFIAKQRINEFNELFAKHKHLFVMNCDMCENYPFETFYDAREHYTTVHKISQGYIRCCSTKLRSRYDVKQHLQRHLNPELLTCKDCDKVFTSEYTLKRHMKYHAKTRAERKIYPCSICNKLLSSKISMKNHIKLHENKPDDMDDECKRFILENFDMKCDNAGCDAQFDSYYEAKKHYKDAHNYDQGYIKCCGTKFRQFWMVTDHVKAHLNPSHFKCEECGRHLTSKVQLGQHRRRHQREKNKIICDMCGKGYKNKETILKHFYSAHITSEPKYECNLCGKRFRLDLLLRSHMYAAHRDKRIKASCEICGKGFSIKAHLKKHMLSHTDKSERLAQRQQCAHCGEWLMTKSGMYYHDQIHTSGPQTCDQCQKQFPHKIALLAHIRIAHREPRFKCNFCGRLYYEEAKLRKHEEQHTRHKTYQCEWCPKVFTIPSSLKTHYRRHHREEVRKQLEQRKLITGTLRL